MKGPTFFVWVEETRSSHERELVWVASHVSATLSEAGGAEAGSVSEAWAVVVLSSEEPLGLSPPRTDSPPVDLTAEPVMWLTVDDRTGVQAFEAVPPVPLRVMDPPSSLEELAVLIDWWWRQLEARWQLGTLTYATWEHGHGGPFRELRGRAARVARFHPCMSATPALLDKSLGRDDPDVLIGFGSEDSATTRGWRSECRRGQFRFVADASGADAVSISMADSTLAAEAAELEHAVARGQPRAKSPMRALWDFLDLAARADNNGTDAAATPRGRVNIVASTAADLIAEGFEPLATVVRAALDDESVELPAELARDLEAHLQMISGWLRSPRANPVVLEALTADLIGLYLQLRDLAPAQELDEETAAAEESAVEALGPAVALGAEDEAAAVETMGNEVLPSLYGAGDALAEQLRSGDGGGKWAKAAEKVAATWDAGNAAFAPWVERLGVSVDMIAEVLAAPGRIAKRLWWVSAPSGLFALWFVVRVVQAVYF